MPATTIQVRTRAAARRTALARQQKLNEERARRDAQELDLAAEFAVLSEECAAARAAVTRAEMALGRIVDSLVGDLRIRYERAAQLLDTAEDELKRLRQLAADASDARTPATPQAPRGARRRARTRPSTRPESPPGTPEPDADGEHQQDTGHGSPVRGDLAG